MRQRHQLPMRIIIAITFAIALAMTTTAAFAPTVQAQGRGARGANQTKAVLSITIRVSHNAAFATRLDMKSGEFTKALKQAKEERADKAADAYPDVWVESLQDDKNIHYRLEKTGNLWSEEAHKRYLLQDKARGKLLLLAGELRKQHYGAMKPWESVTQTFPKKSIFDVTDMESGLTFRVQRRAGSDHADVQPLTKADTQVMKRIYNDNWSWNRKAVLVHAGGHWIAASMNGMPHGGDGIPENGFSGHFCIHFLGSSTHKSEEPDLAHQLMVHKAGGELQAWFDSATPHALAKMFVVLLKHQDEYTLRQLAQEVPEEKVSSIVQLMGMMMSIKDKEQKQSGSSSRLGTEADTGLTATVTIPVAVLIQNQSERDTAYRFEFRRAAKDAPWRMIDVAGVVK